MTVASIPAGLAPFFQEYDLLNLDLDVDATLVIQRTLEYGTWDEVRWLFVTYGAARVKTFIRERGERMLSKVTFNWARRAGSNADGFR